MDPSKRREDRIANKRRRRWRRRARIVTPFLMIPLLVGTVVLSVGIIEYAPKEPKAKLTEKPISKRNLEYRKRLASRRPGLSDAAVLTSPAVKRSERLIDSLRPVEPRSAEGEFRDTRADPLPLAR